MAYITDIFKPEKRGEYWRQIVNMIKYSEPYSIDLVETLLREHPRDEKGEYVFPYCKQPHYDNNFDIIENHIAKQTRFGLEIYNKYQDQLIHAYKISSTYLLKYPYLLSNVRYPELNPLIAQCIELNNAELKSKICIQNKMKNFWFSSGYSYFIDKLINAFIPVFLAEMDTEFLDRYDIKYDGIKYIEPESKSFGEWAYKNIPGIKNMTHLSKYLNYQLEDSLESSTNAIVPIGELETLRALARKIWKGKLEEAVIEPFELLILQKYVSISSITIDMVYDQQKLPNVNDLRERRVVINTLLVGEFGSLSTKLKPIELMVANAFADLWDELNYYNLHHSYKGSFECIECGTFIQRSFDAYGQKYCSPQCKKRANKRSYQQNIEKRRSTK